MRGRLGVVPVWNAATVVVPSLAILLLGYHRRWLSDDGLIYSRTVHQILAGHGPVFSPGERAEASTSTLWQWLLALGGWVTGADLGHLAVLAGLVLTVTGFGLALDGTRRLHARGRASDQRPPLLLPAGILVLLAVPPVWDYATSGLETGLGTFWLGLSWWLLVCLDRMSSTRTTLLCAFVVGLGPLVRPDLVVISISFLLSAWLLIGRPGWRSSALHLLTAAGLSVAYEIFRMGYYGILVPLPALTKEASGSFWRRGWLYLNDFLGPYWLYSVLLLVGVLAAFALLGRNRARGRSGEPRVLLVLPILTGLVMTLYVVKVGGDWMHARMLLPALSVLLLPFLTVPLSKATGMVCFLMVVWTVTVLSPLRPAYARQVPQVRVDADARQEMIELTHNPHPLRGADLVQAFAAYKSVIDAAQRAGRPVLLAAGSTYGDDRLHPVQLAADKGDLPVVVGSYLGMTGEAVPLEFRVVDQLSLAYPLGAHFTVQRWLWPGHEKLISNIWVLADYAAPGAAAEGPHAPEVTPAATAAARHALQCGQLRELQDSVRQPLTLQRFWLNLTGAPRRTALRIPRDPGAAERTFCCVKGQ